MIGQSCVNKDGGCSTLSLSEESACRSLFGSFARRRRGKASKTKPESVHAAMDFPERGEGRVHQLIRELEVGDVVAYKVSQRLQYPSRSLHRENFRLSESLWSTASNSSSPSAASAMFFFNLSRSRASITANHKR